MIKMVRAESMAVVIALAGAFPPAAAQEVFAIGLGTNSCSNWLEAKTVPHARAAYRNWVLGFLTGVNWHAPESQARIPDGDAAVVFVDGYCTNNPLHIVALAAAALVQDAGGPKAHHQWKR